MEATYTRLQKDGKNDVETLIKWLKDSEVIEQDQEDKVRSYFNEVTDKLNVPLDTFKEVTRKVAVEFIESLEDITKKLANTRPNKRSNKCFSDKNT